MKLVAVLMIVATIAFAGCGPSAPADNTSPGGANPPGSTVIPSDPNTIPPFETVSPGFGTEVPGGGLDNNGGLEDNGGNGDGSSTTP